MQWSPSGRSLVYINDSADKSSVEVAAVRPDPPLPLTLTHQSSAAGSSMYATGADGSPSSAETSTSHRTSGSEYGLQVVNSFEFMSAKPKPNRTADGRFHARWTCASVAEIAESNNAADNELLILATSQRRNRKHRSRTVAIPNGTICYRIGSSEEFGVSEPQCLVHQRDN